jgi:DNA gyrase inhibitor GyrI
MKALKIIGIVAGIVVVVLVSFSFFMGLFSSVQVSRKTMGPYTMMYEPFVGPYEKTQAAFEKVQRQMKAENLDSTLGIGIYYDNPAQVDPRKCRSECGALISGKDLSRLGELSGKSKIKTIVKGEFLYAEFPYKNSLSFMMGPMKVYPLLFAELIRNGFKPTYSIELYDMKSDHIAYLVPIVK